MGYYEDLLSQRNDTPNPDMPAGMPKGYYITAYGIAVKHGFQGTEEEWLDSLKGEGGETGAPGPQGPKGDTGSYTAGDGIIISAGTVSVDDTIARAADIPAPVTVDTALSAASENPVQNKVITEALAGKETKIHRGSTAPTDTSVLWLDTSESAPGSGGSYTLPVAAETTLGGLLAKNRLSVASDGTPTINIMPDVNGWTLIGSVTLTADDATKTVTFSQDSDGNSFSYDEIFIDCSAFGGASSGIIRAWFNRTSVGGYGADCFSVDTRNQAYSASATMIRDHTVRILSSSNIVKFASIDQYQAGEKIWFVGLTNYTAGDSIHGTINVYGRNLT